MLWTFHSLHSCLKQADNIHCRSAVLNDLLTSMSTYERSMPFSNDMNDQKDVELILTIQTHWRIISLECAARLKRRMTISRSIEVRNLLCEDSVREIHIALPKPASSENLRHCPTAHSISNGILLTTHVSEKCYYG